MNKSESIASLAAALAKAQAGLKNPAFDSSNPHFKNKYASLASVRDTITPVLSAHGIAVLQLLGKSDVGVSCETVLTHESGEWISSTIEIPATKQDAQGYGSASSYARRYALMAIVNVVGDVDDDANEASKPKNEADVGREYALHLNAIEGAGDEVTLKAKFGAAWQWAGFHPEYKAKLTAAKDKQKAKLEEAA